MELKRVVITGMGALTPIGNNVNAFWQSLLQGKSGSAPITRFDATHFKTRFACEVKGFDALEHFDRKEARKLDLFAQFALVSVEEAIQNAHLEFEKLNRDKIGVIWSSGIGGFTTFQEEVLAFGETKLPRFNPFFITKMISDIVPGHISIKHGLRGLNYSTVSACASSTNALIDAFNYIRLGKAHVIITGGSEAPIVEAGIGGFNAMKAHSENNEEYATGSRPFDKHRDGFVLGEGAGALIVEELEHALARGATIYAEIIGGGLAADAYHVTATHPEGIGAYLAMKDALEDAHISPSEVDYINAHATSTGLGDVSETKAIGRLFHHSLSSLHISATKSMTGHLLGAAGAIEAIATVHAIQHDLIPPTMHNSEVDPDIHPGIQLTLHKPVQKPVNIALSNTFGFGGHNAILALKKWRGMA